MPQFDKAEKVKIRSPQERTNRIDLTPYKNFLQKYKVGVTVDLPLESGESTRAIKRRLTLASKELGMRLALPPASGEGSDPVQGDAAGEASRPATELSPYAPRQQWSQPPSYVWRKSGDSAPPRAR